MTKTIKVLLIILLVIGCVVGGLYIHDTVNPDSQTRSRLGLPDLPDRSRWIFPGRHQEGRWIVPD